MTPDLGFGPSGEILPGGLQQFGRCLARALASYPEIEQLDVWSQRDPVEAALYVKRMLAVGKRAGLRLRVRTFANRRLQLSCAVFWAGLQGRYDRIVYALINQGVLSLMPFHAPATIWQIGAEVSKPLSWRQRLAFRRAQGLLSISQHTASMVRQSAPRLPLAQVIHLCVEPPLWEAEPAIDPVATIEYEPELREPAVLIVGTILSSHLYKGHQQLIASWPYVSSVRPDAQLWIAGGGDATRQLVEYTRSLSAEVSRKVRFFGAVTAERLDELYRTCRVFAMPSSGEGFGLVFVEAARYGLPCIGGKYDSVAEVVLDEQTGLLVEKDPYEIAVACLRLLNQDDTARRLGQAGRQRYLNHFRFQHFRERLRIALGYAASRVDRPREKGAVAG